MNLEEVFRLILVTSAMGTIVALLILFVKSVLGRHINAHWGYLIWFVLLVRLVFPFAPESPTSVYNFLVPYYSVEEEPVSHHPEETYEPESASEGTYVEESRPDEIQQRETPFPEATSPVETEGEETGSVSVSWLFLFSLLWLMGVALLAGYTFQLNFRWWLKLKKSLYGITQRQITFYRNAKKK